MDESISTGDSESFDLESEEELDMQDLTSSQYPKFSNLGEAHAAGPSCSKLSSYFVGMGFSESMVAKAIEKNGEGDKEAILETLLTYSTHAAGPSCSQSAAHPFSNLISHFVGMGFSETMVIKAIEENGEGDKEAIVETLLTYSAIENSPPECQKFPARSPLPSEMDILDTELSDVDSCPGNEGTMASLFEKDETLLHLVEMGFDVVDATSAMDRCGPNVSVEELADSICAAQMAGSSSESDDTLRKRKRRSAEYEAESSCSSDDCTTRKKKKWPEREYGPCYLRDGSRGDKHRRKWYEGGQKSEAQFQSQVRAYQENILVDEDNAPLSLCIPTHMIGFGVPDDPTVWNSRKIPEAAIGPPYFYYENVALAPKGVWECISSFLFDIEPEFVDSKHFCAAARKRGYIHNLPILNRFPLQPLAPRSIHEALPMTRKWWPLWDLRTQLNCLQTCTASAKLTERIRKALECSDDPPSCKTQQYVLNECRKWNLVWVGRHKAAPLEPDEVEMLLGFPRNHTRGGGISRTQRYVSLGNSFQVDTVAYHLSVLKDLFPNGIRVLSLFSGIGGAEVALHRLGIPLRTVVSVEISEVNRNIVRSWWEQTNQQGNLIDIADIQKLNTDRLEQMINAFGGFDLIIGGSPCNNLTGSNRVSRHGLEGKDSILFYEYFRILEAVKIIMGKS